MNAVALGAFHALLLEAGEGERYPRRYLGHVAGEGDTGFAYSPCPRPLPICGGTSFEEIPVTDWDERGMRDSAGREHRGRHLREIVTRQLRGRGR